MGDPMVSRRAAQPQTKQATFECDETSKESTLISVIYIEFWLVSLKAFTHLFRQMRNTYTMFEPRMVSTGEDMVCGTQLTKVSQALKLRGINDLLH